MNIDKSLAAYLAANTRIQSRSTINHYRITLRQYQSLCGRNLRSLSDENLAKFLRHLLADDLAPATVNQKRNYVCAFWRWCAKRGLTRKWPTVQPIKEPERIPDAWTIPQLEKLFAACRAQEGWIEGIRAAGWWTTIHYFWWYTGERAWATVRIGWEHYNGETIIVPAELRKGGQKTMVYSVVPQLQAAIESIRLPERELIWPWPYHVQSLYNHYRKLLISAGLPYRRYKSGPQKMRRSYASHLEAAGGDATAAMRHTKRSVTEKGYIDPRIAQRPNPARLLPRVG